MGGSEWNAKQAIFFPPFRGRVASFLSGRETQDATKLCADETFTEGSSAGSPILGRRSSGVGTSSAQYLVDHIFVYRRDQNLPYKCSDV